MSTLSFNMKLVHRLGLICLVCESTTARIQPSSRPHDTPHQFSKTTKVDFAIILDLHSRRRRVLSQKGIESLGQSQYGPIQYCPIAVNIETKLPGDDWTQALQQLSTWTCAQILELKGLLSMARRSQILPPLPVLIVQGHDWFFGIVEYGRDETGTDTAVCYQTL